MSNSATSAAEAVSDVISQEAAMRCIHVPRFDTTVASQIARKMEIRSGPQGDSLDWLTACLLL